MSFSRTRLMARVYFIFFFVDTAVIKDYRRLVVERTRTQVGHVETALNQVKPKRNVKKGLIGRFYTPIICKNNGNDKTLSLPGVDNRLSGG
uniref:Putative secreted protein n=1 Tax=Ixodes ricinus TaxID=34613 RepID=A0A6B0U1D2_IXORI